MELEDHLEAKMSLASNVLLEESGPGIRNNLGNLERMFKQAVVTVWWNSSGVGFRRLPTQDTQISISQTTFLHTRRDLSIILNRNTMGRFG
jgi:hypothetical protein